MKNKSKVQLTDKQVKELFDYTDRMHIKYKDVQYEIVDHIASGVEDTLAANNKLTFNKALYNYAGTLPMRFFNDLIEEKEKALTQFWNRKFGKYLLGFLNIPRIIASGLLYFISYNLIPFLNFGVFTSLVLFIIFTLIEFVGFPGDKLIADLDTDYLVIKTYNKTILSLAFGFFGMNFYLIVLEFDLLMSQSWGLAVIAFAVTSITLFSYSVRYVFPKMLKAEIETKYAHHNINLA